VALEVSLHYVLDWLQGDLRNKEDLEKLFSQTQYVYLRFTFNFIRFLLNFTNFDDNSSDTIFHCFSIFLLA
jgi:hypothetical protein